MNALKIKDGNTWIPVSANGIGVPLGGNQGQILTKASSTDYDAGWTDIPITIKSFTITLDSTLWVNNIQVVSNAYFVATGYIYFTSPASSNFEDYCEAQIYADNVTVDGQMTFHCINAPASDMVVNIVRMVSA